LIPRIKRDGPKQQTCEANQLAQAAVSYFLTKKPRRTSVMPYGPRLKKAKKQLTELGQDSTVNAIMHKELKEGSTSSSSSNSNSDISDVDESECDFTDLAQSKSMSNSNTF
jgi:hypothetical protein